MKKDFHELPRLKDSISYIYVEHAIIEQRDSSIVIIQKDGIIPIPIASTTCLMIGPGTSVTHAAIKAICDNGCMAVWCGQQMERFYASGIGETRNAKNILLQASLCMDADKHLAVARRMYERRFPQLPPQELTLQQLRGMEGIRVREAYKLAAKVTGIRWSSRQYKSKDWEASDPINKALSEANAILYNLCHAAIISLGYSPALGFVHTGKMLSFVYDIADLYKAETTIPAAFEAVRIGSENPSQQIRMICRRYFERMNILKRIPQDIEWIFRVSDSEQNEAKPVGDLWDNQEGCIEGGNNYGGSVDF